MVDVPFGLTGDAFSLVPSPATTIFYHKPVEEIAFGPASWMWDYIR